MPINSNKSQNDAQAYASLAQNIIGMLKDSPACENNHLLQELKKLQVEDATNKQLQDKVIAVFRDRFLMHHLRVKVKGTITGNEGQYLHRLNGYATTMKSCKEKLLELHSDIGSYEDQVKYLQQQQGVVEQNLELQVSRLAAIDKNIAGLCNNLGGGNKTSTNEPWLVASSALGLLSIPGSPVMVPALVANGVLSLCMGLINVSKQKEKQKEQRETNAAITRGQQQAKQVGKEMEYFSQLSTDVQELLQINNQELAIAKMQKLELLQHCPKEFYAYINKKIKEAEGELETAKADIESTDMAITARANTIRGACKTALQNFFGSNTGRQKISQDNLQYIKLIPHDIYLKGVQAYRNIKNNKNNKGKSDEEIDNLFYETDAGKNYLAAMEKVVDNDKAIVSLGTQRTGLKTTEKAAEKEVKNLNDSLPSAEEQKLRMDTQERRAAREKFAGITRESLTIMQARSESFVEKTKICSEVHDTLDGVLQAGNNMAKVLVASGAFNLIGVSGEIPEKTVGAAIQLNDLFQASVQLRHIGVLIGNPYVEWSKLIQSGIKDASQLFQVGMSTLKTVAAVIGPASIAISAGVNLLSLLFNSKTQQADALEIMSQQMQQVQASLNNLAAKSDIYFRLTMQAMEDNEQRLIKRIDNGFAGVAQQINYSQVSIENKIQEVAREVGQGVIAALDEKDFIKFEEKSSKIRAPVKGGVDNDLARDDFIKQLRKNFDYLKHAANKSACESRFTHANLVTENLTDAKLKIGSEYPELSIAVFGFSVASDYLNVANPYIYTRCVDTACKSLRKVMELNEPINYDYYLQRLSELLPEGKKLQQFFLQIQQNQFWEALFEHYIALVRAFSCCTFDLLESCARNKHDVDPGIYADKNNYAVFDACYFDKPVNEKLEIYCQQWNGCDGIKLLAKELHAHYLLMQGYVELLARYTPMNLRSSFAGIPNSAKIAATVMCCMAKSKDCEQHITVQYKMLEDIGAQIKLFSEDKATSVPQEALKININDLLVELSSCMKALEDAKAKPMSFITSLLSKIGFYAATGAAEADSSESNNTMFPE